MIKRFLGIGWKSKIIFKRATAYISINKLIVDGCDLKKGEELYSCLAEDKRRKIIIIYLDGKKANKFKV
ncbi:MAG: hypothetical protein Q8P57_02935 [Candidatus Pacearchaeota archaeon]|nr:hypothetical protein [Candidatus Pacearchaeota archaeon]